MFFLSLNNADIDFKVKGLTQRKYSTAKALPTISQIQLINKCIFIKTTLDKNLETFVVYIIVLKTTKMTIYPF